jgi:hypothetical protein
MNVVRLALFCSALALPLAGVAVEADPSISLPCEPSRACAIEMARAAAYENERRSEGNFGQMSGLLAIATVQLDSGDITGFTATAAEARRAIDGSNPLRGGLDSLAQMQARAGLFDEALATAGDSRTGIEREIAYRSVAEEFARRGRWREALSARTAAYPRNISYAKSMVMKDLVQSGRRDWVTEALPTLAPDREAEVLTEFERLRGNLGAAREYAVRIADPETRWMPLLEIANAGIENEQWDEVVAVARFAAAEGESADTPDVRHHRVYFAITWLSAAHRFDEALSLVPKYREEFHMTERANIASDMVIAGEFDRARAMLESFSPEYQAEVQGKIAIARVLAGEQRFEKALAAFPAPAERLAALLVLGEKLPEARSKEARDVLRAAVEAAEQIGNDRDSELETVGELQAKRGFIADARATAARIEKGAGKYRVVNLCLLHGAIMKAQAARGDLAGARKTFTKVEPLLQKAEINGYTHSQFINDLATAGLLPEAFAQVQVLSRRARTDWWYDSQLFPVIRAHVESGQLRRAFEIAALVSEHRYGDSDYFLEIARALEP